MEKISSLKLENKFISKEEALENAPKLFQPIGKETVKNGGRVKIENENLTITIQYDEVNLNIDSIPRNEEEMGQTNLNMHERRLIRFLDFKPESFYELKYFLIENKNDFEKIELEEYDTRKIKIYVLKNGNDVDGSLADSIEDYVKLNAEPKTAAALLTAFHEIGHKKDPNISMMDAFCFRVTEKDNTIENKKMIDRERYAWAYSLSKLKPFFTGIGIDQKDLNIFIHEKCLGSYSEFIKNS